MTDDASQGWSEDLRPDPDALLKKILKGQRGHHRIYLGAAAGVGKTYRALQELHEQHKQGVDAIVGVVETHGRRDTQQILEGLEVFPRRSVPYKNVVIEECDLEGLLLRKPSLVLIDELAHSNAPGVTHRKRYEDVEVLLANGVNVISTLNIQHLESANDLIARFTGAARARACTR